MLMKPLPHMLEDHGEAACGMSVETIEPGHNSAVQVRKACPVYVNLVINGELGSLSRASVAEHSGTTSL